jgi:hypothetical protein
MEAMAANVCHRRLSILQIDRTAQKGASVCQRPLGTEVASRQRHAGPGKINVSPRHNALFRAMAISAPRRHKRNVMPSVASVDSEGARLSWVFWREGVEGGS